MVVSPFLQLLYLTGAALGLVYGFLDHDWKLLFCGALLASCYMKWVKAVYIQRQLGELLRQSDVRYTSDRVTQQRDDSREE